MMWSYKFFFLKIDYGLFRVFVAYFFIGKSLYGFEMLILCFWSQRPEAKKKLLKHIFFV